MSPCGYNRSCRPKHLLPIARAAKVAPLPPCAPPLCSAQCQQCRGDRAEIVWKATIGNVAGEHLASSSITIAC
uniref:Uncharacterized protein n=1 Tax=Oryza sativa subsp. japonica TaxID=39947 RepID=Q5Z4D0_ORYSJ|nr:hypothetical protein [Oryza sativa Japonica Group]